MKSVLSLLLLLAVLLLLLLVSGTTTNAATSSPRPHILLMCLDDIGHADTGIHSRSNIPMPHLVKLAKEGAVLDNFYTQTVCSPTRSALMAGRYPFRFGMQHFTTVLPFMSSGMPLDSPILPELLKDAGYDTHMIGKWHCGYATWQHTPFFRGFSSFLGFLQAQQDYYRHNFAVFPKELEFAIDGLDFWRDDKPMWSAVGNHSLDLFDRELTRVLSTYARKRATAEERAAHPLFIYLAHQTVHIPLQAKRDEFERCGHLKHKVRRVYCDMLVELDDSVGSMIGQYKQHGLWDNTLVLVLTDNGGMVNFDSDRDGFPKLPASQGSNYPLRGSKMTLFDGGVRSLGFISGGHFPVKHAGRRYTGLAHVVDFTATVLAAAQLYPLKREKLRLDGVDLLPLIRGTGGSGQPRTEVPINIVNAGERYSAVRWGKYKLIVKGLPPSSSGTNSGLVVASSFFDQNGDLQERMPDADGDSILLYDLDKDVQERRNLAADRPDLVQHGRQLIASYVTSGDYMEPQESGASDAFRAFYNLHSKEGRVWSPFMSSKEWRKNFAKQQRAAGILSRITDEDAFTATS